MGGTSYFQSLKKNLKVKLIYKLVMKYPGTQNFMKMLSHSLAQKLSDLVGLVAYLVSFLFIEAFLLFQATADL